MVHRRSHLGCQPMMFNLFVTWRREMVVLQDSQAFGNRQNKRGRPEEEDSMELEVASKKNICSYVSVTGASHVKARDIRLHQCSETNVPRASTCARCNQVFDPENNHLFACRVHTRVFASRILEFGSERPSAAERTFQGWECCGSADPNAPGCQYEAHVSYDIQDVDMDNNDEQ